MHAPPLPPVPDQYKKMARDSIINQSVALSKLAPPPQIPPPKHHPSQPYEDDEDEGGMMVDHEEYHMPRLVQGEIVPRTRGEDQDERGPSSHELETPPLSTTTRRDEINYFDQGEELIKMRIRTLDVGDGYTRHENEYQGPDNFGRHHYEDDHDDEDEDEVVRRARELDEDREDMESVKEGGHA